jgi:hypothetical protein
MSKARKLSVCGLFDFVPAQKGSKLLNVFVSNSGVRKPAIKDSPFLRYRVENEPV